MAIISLNKTYKYYFFEDAYFIMREPTNQEWNEHQIKLMKPMQYKKNVDLENFTELKLELFEKICIDVVNAYDENNNEIKDLKLIPDRFKLDAILYIFNKDNFKDEKKI